MVYNNMGLVGTTKLNSSISVTRATAHSTTRGAASFCLERIIQNQRGRQTHMEPNLFLDGSWQVIFDDQNKGRVLNWQFEEEFRSYYGIEQVTVPACLEEFRQDYEGVAWYGKTFEMPADWHDKVVRLFFEAVNYRAEVWVNGGAVGHHEGGYTGFVFEVGDLLKPGQPNFIAVRVITPLITRDVVIDGLGRDDMPHWRGAIAGGIWQSVLLIATDSVYIEEVYVRGDIETGEAVVEIDIRNAGLKSRPVNLDWDISPCKGTASAVTETESLTLRPGHSKLKRKFAVENFQLWDLDNPFLYKLTAQVQMQDGLPDLVPIRFGFREFTVKGKNFYLNGKKIVLKTTFNEGFYPHSLAFPRDLELLKKEFRLIKEGNINMIRPWRKPQPSVVYDMADEMGILFVGALPVECMDNWPQITPYARQRIENEVTEMVLRDRNHPSIVIWEMFNEILRDGLKRLRHSTSLKARELDESRLIMDEAGGFAGVCSIYLPGSYEPTPINDVHNYPGTPFDQASYDNLLFLGKSESELKALGRSGTGGQTRSHVEPGLLTNISELGYGSIPDLEANLAQYRREGNPFTPDYRIHERLFESYGKVLKQTGVDQVFPNFQDFVLACQEIHYEGNKLMAEACRINPDIAGIGIHALNDGDWVVGAGLIDNFRNPKRAYYAIKEVFADRYLAVRPSRQNLYAGQDLQINLTAVNDTDNVAGTITVSVAGNEGQALFEVQDQVVLPEGIADLGIYDIPTDGMKGKCQVEVSLKVGNSISVEGRSSFYALDEAESELPLREVTVIDLDGSLGKYLHSMGAECRAFTLRTSHACPVLVNLNGWDGTFLEAFSDLSDWVHGGGTAVFLGAPPESTFGPGKGSRRMRGHLAEGVLLPFPTTYFHAKGLWVPCSHVVKNHQVYDGLPMDCLMSQEYRNVVSRWTMATPVTDWISGTITYDWHAGLKHKQNYIGVAGAMHGADMAQIPLGKGRYILGTHRIVENLGLDPVADRLLSNLLRWVTEKA